MGTHSIQFSWFKIKEIVENEASFALIIPPNNLDAIVTLIQFYGRDYDILEEPLGDYTIKYCKIHTHKKI